VSGVLWTVCALLVRIINFTRSPQVRTSLRNEGVMGRIYSNIACVGQSVDDDHAPTDRRTLKPFVWWYRQPATATAAAAAVAEHMLRQRPSRTLLAMSSVVWNENKRGNDLVSSILYTFEVDCDVVYTRENKTRELRRYREVVVQCVTSC